MNGVDVEIHYIEINILKILIMEKKINIAELLEDCPKGMELYSPIFGKVYLDKIRPHLAIVVTTDKEQGDFKEEFLYDGRYGMNGECMLFPSKGKTTWEGFQRPFKDGDIAVIDIFPFIYKDCDNTEIVESYCGINTNGYFCGASNKWTTLDEITFATEEQKEKLFKAIKENGYHWNSDTKTLEKLIEPKFKIEKGKWYVCIKDLLDKYANTAFCKGNTYLSTQDGSLIPSNSNVPFEVVCASTYFRELPKFKVGIELNSYTLIEKLPK